jgi:hypothetical protein
MLPLGIVGKIAYAPDLDTYGSGDNKGAIRTGTGLHGGYRSATEVQVKAAPIENLSIGASYMEFDASQVAKSNQKPESGAYYATYTAGPISIGYSKAYKAPGLADGSLTSTTLVDYYEQTNTSIAYVNGDLSISYEKEDDEKNMMRDATADVEQESSSIQVAYTMGGMTLAVAHGNYDNAGYVKDTEVDTMLFAVTMAF